MTRSPVRTPVTSSPVASTTPRNSWPIRRGCSGAGSPRYGQRSEPQMQLATTRTTASPGPSTVGSGTCSSRTSNGACRTAALTRRSFGDLHVLPERHPVGDLLGGVLGLGVVPDGVLALRAVQLQGVVGGGALPGADGVGARGAHDVVAQRLAREVVVALDDDGVVALGDHRSVPDGLHGVLLFVSRRPLPAAGSVHVLRSLQLPRSRKLP